MARKPIHRRTRRHWLPPRREEQDITGIREMGKSGLQYLRHCKDPSRIRLASPYRDLTVRFFGELGVDRQP